ncbi:hypothetical protein GCM10009665_46630 [Kitasatospora nipponensis]|uniref:DUF2637 domain-containing protein n=1 Tax=Kitasatospora nipponensis TaxID=258049 RepID=A0ABN1WP17_9ACTN
MTETLAVTPPSPAELHRTGQVITLGTWTLVGAVTTFSAMTGAQFIGAHSPWHWSGWVLAAGIDTAFVMALQTDATLSRYGGNSGPWPTAFRWTTGAFSVLVNIGDSALQHDLVGTAVHLIAPALLLVLGEAGPAWRRQLADLKAAAPERPNTATDHLHTEPPADAEEARTRIITGLRNGLSQRETARWAHRSPSYVRKVWATPEGESKVPSKPPQQQAREII